MTVSPVIHLQRERRLPTEGETLVRVGDRVSRTTAVARTQIAGAFQTLSAAAGLGVPPSKIKESLRVSKGTRVSKGDLLGETRALLGLIHNRLHSTSDGIIEDISTVTGQIVLAEPPTELDLSAYLEGEVVRVEANVAVEISSISSMIQGIFGIGQEAFGRLHIVDTDMSITNEDRGSVLVLTGTLTADTLTTMKAHGVAGVVAASASGRELARVANRTLNPAATGDENIGITVVLTEGFGDLEMAKPTRDILNALEGQEVSMCGVTQIRAGVIRPEIIGPPLETLASNSDEDRFFNIGTLVRIVRGEAFGAIGEVVAVPLEHRRIPSGATTLVFEIRLENGTVTSVPRANVEWVGAPDSN